MTTPILHLSDYDIFRGFYEEDGSRLAGILAKDVKASPGLFYRRLGDQDGPRLLPPVLGSHRGIEFTALALVVEWASRRDLSWSARQ